MRVGIVGAGIIGVTTALELARRGHDVTVLDRRGVAAGASAGNAGAFAFADVIPIATPGVMRKAPRWLIDPLGPLSVPPGYALTIAPWLYRFWRASQPGNYARAVKAQAAMMALSRDRLGRLLNETGMKSMLRHEGQLQLYDTAGSFRAAEKELRLQGKLGVRYEVLKSAEALAEVQPGLDKRFRFGVFTPDWYNVTDPFLWTQRIAEEARRRGARIGRKTVIGLRPLDNGVSILTPEGEARFEKVILCAGAWSNVLLAPLGLGVPLETERGYNTTFDAYGFDLKTHLTFCDHGFVATRIGNQMRVGGAVELGGLRAAPRMKRAQAMMRKAESFLPGLGARNRKMWMGFRPSMPDSLPVIGERPKCRGLIMAFGHGHLGLTQSAGTASMVAAMVEGRRPAIDAAPYAPTRFD